MESAEKNWGWLADIIEAMEAEDPGREKPGWWDKLGRPALGELTRRHPVNDCLVYATHLEAAQQVLEARRHG